MRSFVYLLLKNRALRPEKMNEFQLEALSGLELEFKAEGKAKSKLESNWAPPK